MINATLADIDLLRIAMRSLPGVTAEMYTIYSKLQLLSDSTARGSHGYSDGEKCHVRASRAAPVPARKIRNSRRLGAMLRIRRIDELSGFDSVRGRTRHSYRAVCVN